jgi:hypothetical protein
VLKAALLEGILIVLSAIGMSGILEMVPVSLLEMPPSVMTSLPSLQRARIDILADRFLNRAGFAEG